MELVMNFIGFDQRDKALAISVSLLLMTVLGIFAFGVAMPSFNQLMSTNDLRSLMIEEGGTFKGMLVLISMVIVLDLMVSGFIADYFKTVNKKLAYYSGLFRLLYTIVLGIALCFLISYFFQSETHAADFWINMKRFHWVWNLGLGFLFGPHLILTALLMRAYKIVPIGIWGLTALAGVSYVFVHILKILVPTWPLLETVEMILMIPMALGELLIAIWFLVKVLTKAQL